VKLLRQRAVSEAVAGQWRVHIRGEVEPIGVVSADDEIAALRHAKALVEQLRRELSLEPQMLRAEWIYLVPAEPDP
jgi:hypothetical protein